MVSVRICVTINKALLIKVNNFCEHNSMARSKLIRRALEEYMRGKPTPPSQRNLFEQAMDLFKGGN